ncbi:MAG: CRISPR-associated helicase/endonuclease Cas3, partial [Nitrospinota bacterium]|nr:CRISPR-associated helicase/endonuclease Cas3 [Nitrospinota bacterium]
RANKFLRAMEQDPSIPSGVLFRVENVTCPHHGRFARPDREIMDVRVSSMFGKGSADGPAILVGTQTLEQSLDLDADFMITDLCPMDVLLQRIGRLHRRDKPRRPLGYGSGRVAVLVPEDMTMESFLNDRGEAIKREGIGSVYENVGILRLTLDCLHARPVLNIPADNRFLVESATHPEKLNGLTGGKWKRHLNARHGSDLAEKVSARDVSILPILDKPFYDPESPDDSAKFGDFGNKLTRLGAEDRVVEFSAPFLSPFGVEIKEMIVPHHMAPGGEVGNKAEIISGPDEPVRFTFGNKTYTYSRFGLEEEK